MRRPIRLPLKQVKWDEFIDVLGKAHAVLGRCNRSRSRAIKQPFTLTLLRKMHRTIMKGSLPSGDIGRFRQRQNWIGPKGGSIEEAFFLPPRFEIVPEYMENLKSYINSKEKDSLVQIAIFFAQLLIVHPFMDGNGRLARALVPWLLCKKGLTSAPHFSLDNYFKKHRMKYFEKLNRISENNDWEGWIRFFLEGIIEERARFF